MKFVSWGTTYNLKFTKANYINNNSLAVQAWCSDGPYATVTVNLDESNSLKENEAYFDINNCKELYYAMEEEGYIVNLFEYANSGWCSYPKVMFTEEFFKECE